MKVKFLLLTLTLSAACVSYAAEPSGCDAEDLALATTHIANLEFRAKNGEAIFLEIIQAKRLRLETEKCAGKLSTADFCAAQIKLLLQEAAYHKESFKRGEGPSAEQTILQARLTLHGSCPGIKLPSTPVR